MIIISYDKGFTSNVLHKKSIGVNSLKSARCCCRLEQTPLKPFLASALYVTSEQEVARNEKKFTLNVSGFVTSQD